MIKFKAGATMVKKNVSIIMRGLKILFKVEKSYFMLHMGIELLTPLTAFISIYIMAQIVNSLAEGTDAITVMIWVGIMIGANLFIGLTIRLFGHLKGYYENQLYKNEQMYLSEKIMKMNYCDVEDTDTQYLYEKIKSNSQSGYNMFYLYSFSGKCVNNIISLIASLILFVPFAVGYTTDVWQQFSLLAAIAVTVSIRYLTNKKSNAINLKMYNDFNPHNTRFHFYADYYDDYNAGKDIRLYAMQRMLEETQLRENDSANKVIVDARKKMLKFVTLDNFARELLSIFCYLLIIYMCIQGDLQVGTIAMFVAAVAMFVTAFCDFTGNVQSLFDNNKYLVEYFGFLDLAEKDNGEGIPFPPQETFHFQLRNVSFKYPKTDAYVLKSINMEITPNKKIAIVGENGSGKSTLIKLLCRLYDLEEGEILLNGVNINTYNRASYMKSISAVFQDFALFAFTIAENVSYGNDPDPEKVKTSLKKVGFHDRLSSIDNGIDAFIYKDFEQNGIEISGGEAQKIAIARALYRGTDLFLLDEPTSSLDPEAEMDIYHNIRNNMYAESALFVSHRLASCRLCDSIIVLEEGTIVQMGHHDDLLKEEGSAYEKMWNAQANYYKIKK